MKKSYPLLFMFSLSLLISCHDITEDINNILIEDNYKYSDSTNETRRNKQKPKLEYSIGEKQGHQHGNETPFYVSLAQKDGNIQLIIYVLNKQEQDMNIVITNKNGNIIFQESQINIDYVISVDIVPTNEYPYFITIESPNHTLTGTITLVDDSDEE